MLRVLAEQKSRLLSCRRCNGCHLSMRCNTVWLLAAIVGEECAARAFHALQVDATGYSAGIPFLLLSAGPLAADVAPVQQFV